MRITVQEAAGQDIQMVSLTCEKQHAYTQPAAPYTMGTNYLPDSGQTGQLETFNITTTPYMNENSTGRFTLVIKSVTGQGEVTVTWLNPYFPW
jgi:hypothetical protein